MRGLSGRSRKTPKGVSQDRLGVAERGGKRRPGTSPRWSSSAITRACSAPRTRVGSIVLKAARRRDHAGAPGPRACVADRRGRRDRDRRRRGRDGGRRPRLAGRVRPQGTPSDPRHEGRSAGPGPLAVAGRRSPGHLDACFSRATRTAGVRRSGRPSAGSRSERRSRSKGVADRRGRNVAHVHAVA